MDNILTRNESVFFYRQFSNEFTNKNSGRFTIVPRQEVEKLINTEAKFQLSDFSAKDKTAEMQRVLNGTQILSGVIGKVGTRITISVSLYTYPELSQLPGGVDLRVADKDELFDKIPELVQSMQNAIGSERVHSSLEKGISYYQRNEYDRAIFELTDAIKTDPNLSVAFYYRALSYNVRYAGGGSTMERRMADISQSLEDISHAIRLEPNNAYYYYTRACWVRLWSDLGLDQGIADLSQAIRLQPDYYLYYESRGYFYFEKGLFDKAIEVIFFDRAIADLSQAIKLNPYTTEAYHWRAIIYEEKGDYDRSISDQSKIIELYPDYIDVRTCGEAYYYRAGVWEKKGDKTKAANDYAMATELGFFPK
jgi:tetratricopeptide (TPR) repeat protein